MHNHILMGFIYSITSPNNKKYIGQPIYEVEKRIKQHVYRKDCVAIYNAIQCYGITNMRVETLLKVNDNELDVYEKKFIYAFDTLIPNGYNIRTGGSNGKHCEESKEKMRLQKLGDKNHNYGKPRTDLCKLHISEAKSNEKHHFYGKQLTQVHKENLSKSHKEDVSLPMYLVRVKPRPEHRGGPGYAIVNHPTLKCKYFTSTKLTDDQKKQLAHDYLKTADAVQRLNGNG
jgi:group I intron endonuclease